MSLQLQREKVARSRSRNTAAVIPRLRFLSGNRLCRGHSGAKGEGERNENNEGGTKGPRKWRRGLGSRNSSEVVGPPHPATPKAKAATFAPLPQKRVQCQAVSWKAPFPASVLSQVKVHPRTTQGEKEVGKKFKEAKKMERES